MRLPAGDPRDRNNRGAALGPEHAQNAFMLGPLRELDVLDVFSSLLT
jgi:hypothetical protein